MKENLGRHEPLVTHIDLKAFLGDIVLARIVLHPLFHVRLVLAVFLGNVGANVAKFFFDCLVGKLILNIDKNKSLNYLGHLHTLLGRDASLALLE